MNAKDTEKFKNKLLNEKTELEEELAQLGQKNPSNPNDWQANTKDIEVDSADENEVADKLEEFEGNSNIITQLENQLKEVKDALEKIDAGKYGLCEVCGKPIEKERLEAMPSARVSLKHDHK